MTDKEYPLLAKEMRPRPLMGKDCLMAFAVGGAICTPGKPRVV